MAQPPSRGVGRTNPLSEVPEAVSYLEAGRAVGKAVIAFPA